MEALADRPPDLLARTKLQAAFDAGHDAREVYLAWLMTLPSAIDPALAATDLMIRLDLHEPIPPGACLNSRHWHQFSTLLTETRQWPKHRLDRFARRPRNPLLRTPLIKD